MSGSAMFSAWVGVVWARRAAASDVVRRWWLEGLALVVVLVGVVAFGVFFSRLAVAQHRNLNTNALDLGYTDQLLWLTLSGQPYRSTLLEDLRVGGELVAGGGSYRAVHMAPAFVVLAQLYRWWPGAETLLLLQAWALALGAVPAYLLARHRLGAAPTGAVLAVVYLLSPSLAGASLSEFHPIALAAPVVLLGAYLLERRLYGAFAVPAVVLLSLREDMGLVLGLWGVAIAVGHRTVRGVGFGLALAAVSFGWFWYAAAVLIPVAGGPSVQLQGWEWLRRGGTEIGDLLAGVSPPVEWSVLWRPASLRYLGGLLQQTGYLALLAPLQLAPAAPLLLSNILAVSSVRVSESAHYSAAALPFLVLGGVSGLRRLQQWAGGIRSWLAKRSAEGRGLGWLAGAVMGTAVALMAWSAWTHHLAVGVAPWVSGFEAPQASAHSERLTELIRRIPAEAAVSTQSALAPHVSQRARLYLFPAVRDAEYVLLDVTTTPFPVSVEESWYQTQLLLRSGRFGVAAAADGYLLLQRGASVREIPQEFCSFSTAEASDAPYSLVANFGGELQLLGFDLAMAPVRDYDGRKMTLQTYWRAPRRPQADYRFVVTLGDGVSDFVLDGGTATTTWLPTRQWRPGQVMRVTFPGVWASEASDVRVAVVDPRPASVSRTVTSVVAGDGRPSRLPVRDAPLQTLVVNGGGELRLFSLHPFLTKPRGLSTEVMGDGVPVARRIIRSPLCGRPVEDEMLLAQRPVLVKIDNAPAARPQSGLTAACLVYEYMAEGGITRFGAFYHTEDLDTVGPVRSARLMDAELGPAYGALVAHVGGSQPVLAYLRQQQVLDVDQFFNGEAYRRSAERFAPHNVYTNTALLREIGRGSAWGDAKLEAFAFLEDGVATAAGEAAASITVPYSPWSLAEYRWDAQIGGYRRWTAGEPHVDALTGQQLVANNVVLLQTESWPATELIDDPTVMSLRFRMTGEGTAYLFRDGQAFAGRWSRAGRDSIIRFVDTAGRPFAMRPGNVWVQVVTPPTVATWGP